MTHPIPIPPSEEAWPRVWLHCGTNDGWESSNVYVSPRAHHVEFMRTTEHEHLATARERAATERARAEEAREYLPALKVLRTMLKTANLRAYEVAEDMIRELEARAQQSATEPVTEPGEARADGGE